VASEDSAMLPPESAGVLGHRSYVFLVRFDFELENVAKLI
jgi:hypothetical protein